MKNKLEELRKEKELSQEMLGSILDVSRQTISSLENGRYNPLLILAYIDSLFSCWVIYLFCFERV